MRSLFSMSRRARGERGYTLLAVSLVLIALTLVVAAGFALALSERKSGTQAQLDAAAQSIAEAGLQRTVAYLSAIADADGDYDRALDPGLDTTCAVGTAVTFAGNQADDNVPPFAGTTVAAGPAGRTWRQVSHAGGAYLVRVDDNLDDRDPSTLWGTSTGNNGCTEGPALGAAKENVRRDRDRVVSVTVIGIYPGTAYATARSRHTLRVEVAPSRGAGLIAGGTVDFNGTSQICGAYGDIQATGDVTGGCLCGAGCTGGPAYNHCPGNSCQAQAAGSTCSAGAGGSGSVCDANAPVPPPPPVHVWASNNAPPASSGPNYIPFWYVLLNEAAAPATAELWAWNYGAAGCSNPRAWPRICRPGEAAAPCNLPVAASTCWTLIRSGNGAGAERQLAVQDAAAFTASALPLPAAGVTPVVLEASVGCLDGTPESAGCAASDTAPYPGAAVHAELAASKRRQVTWSLEADGSAGVVLPRGVWFIEGDLDTRRDTPACGALPAGWSASLLVTGDVQLDVDTFAIRPAHPKGYVLQVGRDLKVTTGNSRLYTCGTSAAVLVHEQFEIGGNMQLEAQLVAENKAFCSDHAGNNSDLTAPAASFAGNAAIFVPAYPPYSAGRPATTQLWSESTH